jgi:hypothetical protein
MKYFLLIVSIFIISGCETLPKLEANGRFYQWTSAKMIPDLEIEFQNNYDCEAYARQDRDSFSPELRKVLIEGRFHTRCVNESAGDKLPQTGFLENIITTTKWPLRVKRKDSCEFIKSQFEAKQVNTKIICD